ncbi:MAG: ABC transporter substrate-binding protein [Chloroflexi bacterium]|nr:ABC transporter substrate-binding protein [Chloroflexota bacterium]
MKRFGILIALALLLVSLMPLSTGSAQDGPEFPLTIEDETGAALTFEEPVEDILCLSIACLDHLYVLGLEPVGMTDLLTIPYEQHFGELNEDIVVIEGGMQPDLEQIAALDPDVVIGQVGFFEPLREPLQSIAPLYLILPRTVDNTAEQLRTIATITGDPDAAEPVIAAFSDRYAAYEALAPDDTKSILIVFGAAEDDTMFVEADNGQTCMLFEDLATCPFELPENAGPFGAFGYEYFSFEAILEVDPDVIFFSGYDTDRTQNDEVIQAMQENPLWMALSAVENDAVYSIVPWVWRGGHGFHFMTMTLDEAMPLLYPDVFPEPLTEEEIQAALEAIGDEDEPIEEATEEPGAAEEE